MTQPRPQSALNLRLVLAVGGGAVCLLLAVLLLSAGYALPGLLLLALAVAAAVDVAVLVRRRTQRAAAHRGADHRHDGLFE